MNAAEADFYDKAWRYFRLRRDRAAGASVTTDAEASWRNVVKQRKFKERADELKRKRKG